MFNNIIKLAVVITIGFISVSAHAYEVKNVCASYQSGYNWTRGQSIYIEIHNGMDLQMSSYGYNSAIKSYKHYVAVRWQNGGMSVIELTSPYMVGMMMFNTEGMDGEGRKWRFSDNNGYCI